MGLLIISLYGYFVVVYLPSCSMSRLPARGRRPRDGKKGLSARREIINNKINHVWEINSKLKYSKPTRSDNFSRISRVCFIDNENSLVEIICCVDNNFSLFVDLVLIIITPCCAVCFGVDNYSSLLFYISFGDQCFIIYY